MGRIQTDKNKQLKRDAIKLRQDLGWSERRIGEELGVSNDTIHNWLQINKQFTHVIIKQSRHVLDNSTSKVLHNPPLALNRVHVMDCVTGLGRLPHNYIDLIFADPPYNIGISYNNGEAFTDSIILFEPIFCHCGCN